MAGRRSPDLRSSRGWARRKCCTSISPTGRRGRNQAQRGCACPATKSRSRTRTGSEVADNEEGILWVRGDFDTPLYWNRPDKTAETIREEGWIYTGDRFVRDSDGFYFFRGRADDLIKISGQWVYPLEVELCLAEHPEVRECAVFAAELPDRRMTLKAVVVMNNSHLRRRRREQNAAGFCEGKTAAVQIPARSQIHRGIAEDRHRQDRSTSGDQDLVTSASLLSVSSLLCKG